MRDVMEALRKREAEEKVPAIRLEIDYYLMTLYDAMQEDDENAVKLTKEKLQVLSEQLNGFES
ncbi:hypothetical protein SAMN05421663_103331 [Terribacillus halophilus]|uniref:Uncharacterized protein n=1 Tax=Terribacillus halophilus TaxID=361279 RepID=A0A1G6NLF8_9BACI|nr:hypothetical protein [Terribacillus halophilus]SDC68015.1 hypothetical protein SAMN05421663_103331 [Terribacillus halophilus]